jgi:alkylation response protein AidB-like acyl-CoA dehydrogenase
VYFGLPADALALREGLREVLAGACTPATIRSAWDGSDAAGLWKELAGFGLFGLLVPEDRGGLGLDELSFVAAMEECGYAGVPGPLIETIAFLPMTDLPSDGSARIAAQRLGIVDVPYAAVATHVVRLGDMVTLPAPSGELIETTDRSRAALRLEPALGLAFVSDEQKTEAARSSARATLGTAAFLLGLARRQLDLTVDYLKTRKQFGVAIGTYQGLKHPLADAVVGTEFAWPAVLMAAQSLATQADDGALRVSHAKVAASDAAYRMSRVCLQAHGAIGYTVEYDLHLFAKRTWALANDWGTSAEHRRVVAHGLQRELST